MATPVPPAAEEIFGLFLAGQPRRVLAVARKQLSLTSAADVPDLSGADRDVILAWAKLLHATGCANSDLGDKLTGRALLVKGYELADAAELTYSASTLVYEVALVDFQLGQFSTAYDECRQAIRLRIAAAEDPLRPMILLGGVLAGLGRYEEAKAARMWALDCAVAVGDVAEWCNALEQGSHFGMFTADYPLVVRSLVLALRNQRIAGLRNAAARTAALLDQLATIPAVAADPDLALRAE
jgi:hypothetical protein